MQIVLTGATGFVASHLIPKLQAAGHEIRTLGRRPVNNLAFTKWDTSEEPEADVFESAAAVIHLAGETVAQRWTDESKKRIRSSRVDGTRHLVEAMSKAAKRPSSLPGKAAFIEDVRPAAIRIPSAWNTPGVSGYLMSGVARAGSLGELTARKSKGALLCASAVGFYGSRGDELLTESSARGSGFLADVTDEWEEAARGAEALGIRVLHLRFGVILGADGGAFPKMLQPFRFGAGGRLGSGKQWMPWVHVEDAVALIVFALENAALRGAVNVTSPQPVTNADFTHALGAVLDRPTLLTVPEFGLKLALGEMADAVLSSERAVPAAAEAAGFHFAFPELEPALRDLTSQG
jgi:uncharacterized protein (TIGR01777 family)